ncbi:MAG: 3-hydroxyacyl-CoA dehydrogenase NAD-binding domain-containing protein [Bacteroidetes bacterium]|jgi:3-hydroxyacyl-CoA dehydrogenase|nr:3-hydroxyacyl-CoA dehydrogenase NAD-binding domain-containing protein [Bacteroidota bacterium]
MTQPSIPFHRIQRVAVLGSGVMGSRIACHLAQTGSRVLLMDLPSENGPRDAIAAGHLKAALKSKPSPLYSKRFADRIETGNFDDDLPRIADCDWIIEVIVERLDIKQQLFERVEQFRKLGTFVTSNTSGIPIAQLSEGRSEDFQKHFCGTHFFNPPRYLPLLEIIPGPHTAPDVLAFFTGYGERILGKQVVLCKDTPAFIANRVGVFAIQALFHAVEEMGLSVEAVDKLTGPAMGRPKSATFRTCDVVGLDTLIHVANGVATNCPDDERKNVFAIPTYVQHLVDTGALGAKSGAGFYKKTVGPDGKKEILVLDLKTLEYRSQIKPKYDTLEAAKKVDSLPERTKLLFEGTDVAGEFYRRIFSDVFAYVSNRVPEISNDPYRIDDALRAGFGWELGAFESWDAIGIEAGLQCIRDRGLAVAPWIQEMLDAGHSAFYRNRDGIRECWNPATKAYEPLEGQEGRVALAWLPESATVWSNSGTTIQDLGDGILNVAFHTKMNAIGSEIIEGLNKAIDLAESDSKWRGVVISNEGAQFSAGANVGMIFMLAVEQEWDDLNHAVQVFQNTAMRLRYSGIPVITAPHQLALGGGCELCMHSDKVVAHAETYMGLVEFGVGLIPGGGGTKEFVLRLHDEMHEGDMRINRLRDRFLTIGQAKVSTSAYEAFEHGYLREGIDEVVVNRRDQLARAKRAALELADAGYTQPIERKDIVVSGQEGLGIVYVGAHSMMSGNYMSEHDQVISEKLGYVLCGGDLSERQAVSERYLLDLERKAFIELCMQRKSLERMQSLIQKGKILRN